ncbi:lasso RiPP family leader peptide-containing protein [Thermodesulfobacteriota bacterium]
MSDKIEENVKEAEKETYEKPQMEKKGDLKEITGGGAAPMS